MFHHNFLVNSFVELFYCCVFFLMKMNAREIFEFVCFVSLITLPKPKKQAGSDATFVWEISPLLCHPNGGKVIGGLQCTHNL